MISSSAVSARCRCTSRARNTLSSSTPQNYSIAKQIACHLGEPLNEEEIWEELLLVLPDADVAAHVRLGEMIIAACRRTAWRPAMALDVTVHSGGSTESPDAWTVCLMTDFQ